MGADGNELKALLFLVWGKMKFTPGPGLCLADQRHKLLSR